MQLSYEKTIELIWQCMLDPEVSYKAREYFREICENIDAVALEYSRFDLELEVREFVGARKLAGVTGAEVAMYQTTFDVMATEEEEFDGGSYAETLADVILSCL